MTNFFTHTDDLKPTSAMLSSPVMEGASLHEHAHGYGRGLQDRIQGGLAAGERDLRGRQNVQRCSGNERGHGPNENFAHTHREVFSKRDRRYGGGWCRQRGPRGPSRRCPQLPIRGAYAPRRCMRTRCEHLGSRSPASARMGAYPLLKDAGAPGQQLGCRLPGRSRAVASAGFVVAGVDQLPPSNANPTITVSSERPVG